MPTGKCRICDQEAVLLDSHVLPVFAFRWQRATSVNGHIGQSTEPNRRAQDGEKRPLLCADCEGRLNKSETIFATRIFHLFVSDKTDRAKYGPWLLRFCVSVSWRVLQMVKDNGGLEKFSVDLLRRAAVADAAWKEVLLGKQPNPGKFVQHLLPLGIIDSATMAGMPPNINRCSLRVIEIDFATGDGVAFTYAKLGRFVFLGFVQLDRPSEWVGTKVHGTEWVVEPSSYTVPREFGEYLFARARKAAQVRAAMSRRQRDTAEKSFRKNLDRAAASELIKAMQNDVRLFGDKAFHRDAENADRGIK